MNIIKHFVKAFAIGVAKKHAPAPKVERFSALTPPEPVAPKVVPVELEAKAIAMPKGAVKVNFNVKRAWDTVCPRAGHDLLACFGGGVVKNDDPFVEAWAVAINGDAKAWYLSPDFIVGGGNTVDALPTQVSFITNLEKSQVDDLKAAIKLAVKAGKKGLQIVVTGEPQMYAKLGDKGFDESLGGYALVQVVGTEAPSLVLKCRLADGVTVGLAWKGHPDYVATHNERALIDLDGLTGPSEQSLARELVKAKAEAKTGAALIGLALAARRAGLDVPAPTPSISDSVAEAEVTPQPAVETPVEVPVSAPASAWDEVFGGFEG